jgi:hypothetical protein
VRYSQRALLVMSFEATRIAARTGAGNSAAPSRRALSA